MTHPSVTQQVKFDAICVQFEQAWREGQNPSIEAFLDNASSEERPLLLPQLLLLELEYVENAGTSPDMEAYVERFPHDYAAVRNAFEAHAAASEDANDASVNENPEGTIDQQRIAERAGSQIGRYKLLEQIGEGGMGVVYMAEQQRPVRRKVALKIIKPGMDTKQVVARFEAERQALAMMDHPNIARVLDAGSTESGRPYFVMELVRGTTIMEYCDTNKLDTNERLILFRSVCQAVQHAHTKGIIHRDLKPTNVLVTLHDGVPVPKIIDFGVSKAMGQQLTERTMFTAFAQMVGTPLYMSPEQAEMSGLDIDTRSDIYSLGVLLYELLTGVTPFDRQRLHTAAFDELRRIIREEEPDKPSTRVNSLGVSSAMFSAQRSTDPAKLKQLLRGELDWIVMKTLEKDRTRRYETANALAAEIDRYLNDEPVNACPPSATYRLKKFATRYKTQAAVASLFLFVLLISSIVGWALFADARRAENLASGKSAEAVAARRRAEDAKEQIQAQKHVAEQNLELARDQERKAANLAEELQRRLYDYNLSKALTAYAEGDANQVAQRLVDCLPDQRRWVWHRLNRLNRAQKSIMLSQPPIVNAHLSPVAPLGAAIDVERNLRLFDLADGRTIWAHPSKVSGDATVQFSPGGEIITVHSLVMRPHARFEVWDTTGHRIWEYDNRSQAIVWLSVSADGRYLAYTAADMSRRNGLVTLHETHNSTPLWQRETPEPGVAAFDPKTERLFISQGSPYKRSNISCWTVDDAHVVWSLPQNSLGVPCVTSDGFLLTGSDTHALEIRDPATGEIVKELQSSASDIALHVGSSPNGEYIGSVGNRGQCVIWDWQRKTELLSLSVDITNTLSFSHDGEFLLLGQDDELNLDFKVIDPAPAKLVLAGHEGAVRGVAFSPDGERVMSTGFDGTLRIWDARSGQEIRTHKAGGTLLAIASSPTGNYFSTGGEETVCLWDAETNELVHRWPNPSPSKRWVRSLEFSPDGQRIIASTMNTEGKGVALYDVESGPLTVEHDLKAMHGAVFSPDGRQALLLHYSSGRLDLLDLESNGNPQIVRPQGKGEVGLTLVRISGRKHIDTDATSTQESSSVESSPFLVAAARGATFGTWNAPVEIWNVDSQKQIMALRTTDSGAQCLAVNRDGSRLFSGTREGSVKVWNLETGELLFTMQAHEPRHVPNWGMPRGVMSMALSPDGKTLATTGADGFVKLWETAYPSPDVLQRRRIVREATAAVDRQFAQTLSRDDVFKALRADSSLDPKTLTVALELANVRGDYLDSLRDPLIQAIETAAGIDFDDLDAKPTEVPSYRWVQNAYRLANPAYAPIPIKRQIPLLKEDGLYSRSHEVAFLRGLVNVRLRKWQAADEDFAQALSLAREYQGNWHLYAYRHAFVLAHTEQWDRFEQLCQKNLEKWGDAKVSEILERTAKMCLFSQHDAGVVEQAGRLADLAQERGSDSAWNVPRIALTKGIADLRREQPEAALEMLEVAKNGFRKQKMGVPPMMHLYAAIAHAKLGQLQQAKSALNLVPSVEQDDFRDFTDFIITHIVYREAEAVVAQMGSKADTENVEVNSAE